MAVARKTSLNILRNLSSPFRMKDAIASGISRYMLYELRNQGLINQIARGLYILQESDNFSQPDIITVSSKVDKGIICLISALDYHNLTTQIPHRVHIALPKGSRVPKLNNPPIRVYRFSEASYFSGVSEYEIDGRTVKIYNPEKTLADCFKFRNSLGMDIVLEALKMYKESNRKKNYSQIMEYAKICRVDSVIRPYLEVSL